MRAPSRSTFNRTLKAESEGAHNEREAEIPRVKKSGYKGKKGDREVVGKISEGKVGLCFN